MLFLQLEWSTLFEKTYTNRQITVGASSLTLWIFVHGLWSKISEKIYICQILFKNSFFFSISKKRKKVTNTFYSINLLICLLVFVTKSETYDFPLSSWIFFKHIIAWLSTRTLGHMWNCPILGKVGQGLTALIRWWSCMNTHTQRFGKTHLACSTQPIVWLFLSAVMPISKEI